MLGPIPRELAIFVRLSSFVGPATPTITLLPTPADRSCSGWGMGFRVSGSRIQAINLLLTPADWSCSGICQTGRGRGFRAYKPLRCIRRRQGHQSTPVSRCSCLSHYPSPTPPARAESLEEVWRISFVFRKTRRVVHNPVGASADHQHSSAN